MMLELLDSRVLGAVRFVSAATGLPVAQALRVDAPGVKLLHKREGLCVVREAAGLEGYARAFDAPPAEPPPFSRALALDVSDPSGAWLARRAVLRVPRDPDPGRTGDAGSVFVPVPVRMFPSPALPLAPTWAVVRVTARRAGDGRRVAGALVRVVPADDPSRIGRGMTDAAGEALVALAGVPRLLPGEGDAVSAHTVEATLEVVFDPASARFVADEEVAAERMRAATRARGYPDPDALEARRLELDRVETGVTVAAGRTLTLSVSLP